MTLYEIIQQLQNINNNKNHFLVGSSGATWEKISSAQLRDALNEMAMALQKVADNLAV